MSMSNLHHQINALWIMWTFLFILTISGLFSDTILIETNQRKISELENLTTKDKKLHKEWAEEFSYRLIKSDESASTSYVRKDELLKQVSEMADLFKDKPVDLSDYVKKFELMPSSFKGRK